MTKRTYIDANLLIAAWKGDEEAGLAALGVLDDLDRALLVSVREAGGERNDP